MGIHRPANTTQHPLKVTEVITPFDKHSTRTKNQLNLKKISIE